MRSITQPSKAEAKRLVAQYGHVLKQDGGEYEVYPKGERGAKSYFTNDLTDAIKTARAAFLHAFQVQVDNVDGISPEIRDALCAWHERHLTNWKEQLYSAWYTGRYDGFSTSNVSGYLQRLRNTNGYAVLENLH